MNVDRVELAIDEKLLDLRAAVSARTDCETCQSVSAAMGRVAYIRGLTDALADRRAARAWLADLGYAADGTPLYD